MKVRATILTALLLAAAAQVALAQGSDIILWDNIPADVVDAGSADPDAGQRATDTDSGNGVIIERISDALPERPVMINLTNPRSRFADAMTQHAKLCIARHAVDTLKINVEFAYGLAAGDNQAALRTVENDEGLHLPRLHAEVLRAVGETRPIDISARREAFIACLTSVPLPVAISVSETYDFRIKAGARSLRVLDEKWDTATTP